MITLFIDTHSKNVTYALYVDDVLKNEKTNTEAFDHSTVCMPTLVEFLKENEIDIHDINDIIVVNGPGSFTGVRIGVTIAKTLAYTLNIPIRTLTSLEILLNKDLENGIIAMEEKNGYFIGKYNKDKNLISDYEYLNKNDFEALLKEETVYTPNCVDYTFLAQYAHQKEAINPHLVNPFYVKKIEVEK